MALSPFGKSERSQAAAGVPSLAHIGAVRATCWSPDRVETAKAAPFHQFRAIYLGAGRGKSAARHPQNRSCWRGNEGCPFGIALSLIRPLTHSLDSLGRPYSAAKPATDPSGMLTVSKSAAPRPEECRKYRRWAVAVPPGKNLADGRLPP